MTRIDSRTGEPYNTSAHFLWVERRARSSHIELLSRVQPDWVKLSGPRHAIRCSLIDRLPDGEEGSSSSSRAWVRNDP